MELKFEDLPHATSMILEKLERIENLLLGNSDKPIIHSDKPLTITEAAEFLGVSKSAMYKFTCSHLIPYFKPGKKVYFLKKDLMDYAMQNRIKSHKEIEIEAVNYLAQRRKKYK